MMELETSSAAANQDGKARHVTQKVSLHIGTFMDYRCQVSKLPSLHGQKSNPNPKFIGMAEAYFVCHIGPKFQVSLIYAFIGCP